MGDKADDILQSFNLTEDDAKKYATVKGKFEAHFVKRRNTVFERAKFNKRKQEEGEPIDDFITDLYCLAEHCGYGALHDELVRDRIIVGIRDRNLSEKLQMEPDLSLDAAVTKVRQSEAVKKQQSTVRDEAVVGAVRAQGNPNHKRSNPHRGGGPRPPRQFKTSRSGGTRSQVCTRCGQSPLHNKSACPAREAECYKCHNKGHFKAMCRTRGKVGEVTVSGDDDDSFLGTIEAEAAAVNVSRGWTVKLLINDNQKEFKIDTGADVTVLPESEYQRERDGPLTQVSERLSGASQQPLHVCGKMPAKLRWNDKEIRQDVYVVRGLRKALLGKPAIEALGVVTQVQPILKEDVEKEFTDLFEGLGRLQDNYRIELKKDAQPFALSTPRRVAVPLLPKVKAELQRMQAMGVISKVVEPTEWCAGMVVVPKPNGDVRICVDLTQLNESVCRERHILPSVEQTLAQIGGAKVFTKLDANSGFWQIELEKQSAKLTTFITPFGRFCFNRLPFGITSAPEHFQRRVSEILSGLDGFVGLVDDILVYGATQEEHDSRLRAVLQRIRAAGLTLNKEKCEFSKRQIRFLGQLIDETGVKPDPDKLRAIEEMKPPSTVSEVRRFLGMVNQLGKFSPQLANKTKPLRDLLSSKNHWTWGQPQDQAFNNVKKALSSSEVLALYDPSRETMLSADASSYGIGAVLRQKQTNGDMRPIAYISRALTPTEQRYAQIEKEALAVTWACERFQHYLLGLRFTIQTDHKPLVPLLSTKSLNEVPIRVQRFRLRLMRYNFSIVHVPGTTLCTADTLSRSPVNNPDEDGTLQEAANAYVNMVMMSIPATPERLKEIQTEQDRDEVCKKVKEFCQTSWPDNSVLKGELNSYAKVKDELSVNEDLLLRGSRLIIPTSLRPEILNKLHSAHQGVVKCLERAKHSVWWPGVRRDIISIVEKCTVCCKHRVQHAEPLIPSPFPGRPWEKVGTDLFEWKKSNYIVVIDYYSRYIEIAKLSSTTSSDVVRHLKSIFARHGIPNTVVSDNGPQFSSSTFSDFSKSYGFNHTTSSPRYPQANGQAERAVRTVKELLSKNEDPYLALLAYRDTPLENGYSPAQLLMGRNLRTTVPVHPEQLNPELPDTSKLREREENNRRRQKRNFDHRHRATELKPLRSGENVWIPDSNSEGIVIQMTNPRSYVVSTPDGGRLRRNRRDLLPLPNQSESGVNPQVNPPQDESNADKPNASLSQPNDTSLTRTRSGRVSKPPDRLQ